MENFLPIIYMLLGALLFVIGSYYNHIMFTDRTHKVPKLIRNKTYSDLSKVHEKPKTPEDIAEEKLNNCYQ